MADNNYTGKWLTPDKYVYYYFTQTEESVRIGKVAYECKGFEVYPTLRSKMWDATFNSFQYKTTLDKMWIEDDSKVIDKLQRKTIRLVFSK